MPSTQEIDFTNQLIETLLIPTLDSLESNLPNGLSPKKDWTTLFCKQLSFLRHAVDGLSSYYLEDPAGKLDGRDATLETLVLFTFARALLASPSQFSHVGPVYRLMYYRSCPEGFRSSLPPFKSAFILTDPLDPRHRAFASLRERIGKFLVRAADYLRNEGGDDSTDAVVSLVSTISAFSEHPYLRVFVVKSS